MAQTVADFFLEPLRVRGVKRIFDYPGDGSMDAIGRLDEQFDYVQTRHDRPVVLDMVNDPDVPPLPNPKEWWAGTLPEMAER